MKNHVRVLIITKRVRVHMDNIEYRIIDITQKLWLNYVRESLVETLMSLVSKTEMKNKYLYFIIFRYCELNILISQSSDS